MRPYAARFKEIRMTSSPPSGAIQAVAAPWQDGSSLPEDIDCTRIEVLGINPWKRWQIDGFLRGRFRVIHYAAAAAQALRAQARHGGCIAVWAAREPEGLAADAASQGARLIRIEDGFLRSVGLGSNRVGGASLVLDAEGIYFDPRTPSRLERLLQHGSFDAELLARAAWLRQFLVQQGLTKYNLGSTQAFTVGGSGQRRLLVVGRAPASLDRLQAPS
jgi:capsular polysaccharide export protein